ncbi:MAG: AMP-binding protein [Thermoplasmata archaeon]|nr:AMP-binding protein [Thermoplasmata archaeon]
MYYVRWYYAKVNSTFPKSEILLKKIYYPSLKGEAMIEKTIGDILDETASKYPNNDALVYVDRGLRYSYRDFKKAVDDLAKGLIKLGIKKGDHISIWAYNVPEWVILQFASAKVGAVLVTVNTYYKTHELEYLLKQSDSTTIFLVGGFKDVNYVDTLYKVVPELKESSPGSLKSEKLPFLKNVVFIGKEHHPGMFSFDEIVDMGKEITDEELQKRQNSLHFNDVINMQYTSGTTGFPKGVMLTHYNIVNNAYWVGNYMGFTNKDRLCIPVPFFHCFGCVLSTLNCVVYGATMVPIEIFDPLKVLQAVEKEKCTALHGVPTMFIAELQHPDFDKFDLSSLRTGIMAGAPCPEEIMRQVMEKMHAKEITIAYGLTEASPVLTMTKRDDPIEKRVETVGKALPHIDVKIVDPETGKDLPPETPGELIARGYGIMKGYYKMPDETSKAIRNGWLHTKDLAMMDKDGYFRILGRIDDMIIRGGENVYPREIEEFLYTNPKIKDVAIVGVPSAKYGEEVFAFIQLRNGETSTEEEIKEFCKDKISRFKIPKYIEFVDNFPMTASGKIQKFKLREIAKNILKERGM